MRQCYLICLVWTLLLSAKVPLQAQYFGQNKVGYRGLDFKKMESPNFELYYYTSDSSARHFLSEAEKWYQLHSRFLADSIKKKNPLILYDNHSDFQQTTVFDFTVNVGTGGITEGLKNRVVMPYTHAKQETNHVLGHELVHAFQYNILKTEDSLSLSDIENLPLWMVEGLAEFLSIGRLDPHTAMWMRDAIQYDYFPTLKDLSQNPRYFPYRYGHAFWSFVTGVWGDKIVRPLFAYTAQFGVERALAVVLGYDSQEISRLWRLNTKRYYKPFMQGKEAFKGEALFSKANSGKMNLIPSISPDGQKIVFLSEKNVISLDLYLADVPNKKVIRKINSLKRASHIDFIGFYESAATWSPDSKHFAIVTYARGRNQLAIVDAKSGKIIREIEPKNIRSIAYPSWSPKGNLIAFSGMQEGISDLYTVNLDDESITALTQDIYSDIHPNWHPDGHQLVFASDRAHDRVGAKKGSFNLSILRLSDRSIDNLVCFPGAHNVNPMFTSDARLLFLSDRDGFRNLYAYDLQTGATYLMTHYTTGISGITKYSSAVSFCPSTATLFYNLYDHDSYKIIQRGLSSFRYLPVDPNRVEQSAGYLPPRLPVKSAQVTQKLHAFSALPRVNRDSIYPMPYKAQFQLDYITSAGFGIGSNSLFGTFATGGILLSFSDILGQNQMYTSFSLNGEIIDIAGGIAYINKKKRIDWGATFSHTPFLSAQQFVQGGLDNGVYREVWHTNIIRTFQENLDLFAYLPFSRFRRLQFNAGAYFYHYRIDQYSDHYTSFGGFTQFVGRERRRLPSFPSLWVYNTSLAYVGDNSYTGLVGTLDGYRYRAQIGQFLGGFNYTESLLDGRFYRWWNPVGMALRGMHIGRYGKGSEDKRVFPLNVAFPTLVRGYNYLSIYRGNRIGTIGNSVEGQFAINDFLGSMIGVLNAELRIPFTGPKGLALSYSKFFFTEWAVFFDAGMAYASANYKNILFFAPNYQQKPIYSAGVSLRINLFGFYIIEPFYAFPFQREAYAKRGLLGVNLFPAW